MGFTKGLRPLQFREQAEIGENLFQFKYIFSLESSPRTPAGVERENPSPMEVFITTLSKLSKIFNSFFVLRLLV